MARIPATGIRHLKITIRDASSPPKARTLVCTSQSVPVPTVPEMVDVKPEGDLVAVIDAASVEPTFKIGVLVESFIDATLPTLTEIISARGAGADWTPLNTSLSSVAIPPVFRVFEFVAELRGDTMGGSITYRRWYGVLTAPLEISRADPNIMEFAGKVYGDITDSATAL